MVHLNNFDASKVDPNFGFRPLPNGTYTVVMKSSEERRNKAGTGSYVALDFEVVDGEHQGKPLRSMLNLSHPKQSVVEQAQSELSAICRAVGVLSPQDTSQLHGIPLVVEVSCQKRKDDPTKWQNRIESYKSRQQAFEEQQKPAQPLDQGGGGSQAPPWA